MHHIIKVMNSFYCKTCHRTYMTVDKTLAHVKREDYAKRTNDDDTSAEVAASTD